MLKTFLKVGLLAGVLSLTSLGHAQALPTALAKGNLQIGAGIGYAFPDYAPKNIKGVSAFADYDFSMHFGVEADIHYISLITPTDLGENTFVVGPRYVYRKSRFAPYAKVVFGRGDLAIQESFTNPGKYSGNYFMFGIGGGLDIQATHHIVIRALDVEYQRWPNLGNGLSPTVVTIGAAYRFR
jgi:opacity protein-like surface antigen